MKRRMLILLLSLSCVMATACGSKEAANEVELSKEESAETEAEEPEEEAEPEEETEVEEEVEEEAPEATEEPAEEPEEEKAKEKKEVTVPSELSDDIYSFQVSIDGTVYQFPMWYYEFEALGWEYDGDPTETLSSNQYTTTQVWKKDGITVYTSFANLSINSVPFSESMVAGITLDKFYLEDSDMEIVLPGGITWGVSNADDIKAAYGDPTSDYDGDLYYQMTYEYDSYRDIELSVYKDTNTLQEVRIRNIVELEGADNSVNEEVPDVVKNYKAPAALSDDLYSFNVELEGNLYTLPCPVSEFTANGFKIDESASDAVVPAGGSGWADLRYNNQVLHTMVKNFADYATVVENCFVTSVESADYGPDFKLVLPGDIKRGDSQADLEKKLADFNVEKEESDSYTSYEVYDPDDTILNRCDIIVREGVISTIEVQNYDLKEK